MNWTVFDYGEVIVKRTQAIPKLAATMGVAVEDFEPRYWDLRDPYDRGCADLEYWGGIGAALGVGVDAALSEELTQLDIEGWLDVEPTTIELLEALAEAGVALALLSNAPSSMGRVVERQDWAAHFRTLVFSGDLGFAKPDKRIYDVVAAKLDARPADCLFFDDRQVNVDGAIAAGWKAHRWLGAEEAKSQVG
ncbi:putative hydrolase of the HAD superfamily [Amycolatopsis xylanica]|uniref:Putative hydrolase of the HAD superfamily n=1 Tax=Amycolatopsis xylanica TaxID=589385 RepID=A0A1H2ZXX1_9PSEU|nr:HAD family phosphatase [Amycolatopsis xylanica]SDX22372.1 putative hydrolase of the HAD superfamily [Amycolatopsis xylanica]